MGVSIHLLLPTLKTKLGRNFTKNPESILYPPLNVEVIKMCIQHAKVSPSTEIVQKPL